MEDQNSAVSGNSKSRLRYPLRSATKSKEQQISSSDKPVSNVSKSVSVVSFSSGKDKSGKPPPPRRLSTPAKSITSSAASKQVRNVITPVSEARTMRTNKNDEGKSGITPARSVSGLAIRKRSNDLCSASYWLSQIHLSESAAKHSISLGFFKLALDVGCEPVQQMKDELKSYARRHNLGESVKEIFEYYNICENEVEVQVSETSSQVPEEDEIRSTSSIADSTKRLKPKTLNTEPARVSSAKVSTKKETQQAKTRAAKKKTEETKPVSETRVRKLPNNKSQKPSKVKETSAKKPASDKAPVSPTSATEKVQENKENMDEVTLDEISVGEAV
ncbi:hypothetical protein ACFE04_013219 [Oxalis oulophora]